MPLPNGYSETILTPSAARRAEAIWSFAAQTQGQAVVLPDGRCDLILRTMADAPQQTIPIMTGPASKAYTVTFQPGDRRVGLRLRPDQGKALWKDGITGAENQVLRGAPVLARFPAVAKLCQQATPQMQWAKVALAQIGGPHHDLLHHAIDTIHATGGRLGITPLARRSGRSGRQLNRMFRQENGLSAKTYAQLIQFHRTLHLILRDRLTLAAAAFEGGYADQAHMARSFRRFGGFSPSRIPPDLTRPSLF